MNLLRELLAALHRLIEVMERIAPPNPTSDPVPVKLSGSSVERQRDQQAQALERPWSDQYDWSQYGPRTDGERPNLTDEWINSRNKAAKGIYD